MYDTNPSTTYTQLRADATSMQRHEQNHSIFLYISFFNLTYTYADTLDEFHVEDDIHKLFCAYW